jgi:hypothetical protein
MARSLVRERVRSSQLGLDLEDSPVAATSPVVAPSPLSFEAARSYVDARPFKQLGVWSETVAVARPGVLLRAAAWMALRRSEASYDELWRRCQRANPQWFTSYRLLRMNEPSFFLPAGEVVFQVIENPTQIPDRPPRGVLLRHWEALMAAPQATFYFLRPVFAFDPEFRLYTAADLREEAAGDRDEAIFAARLYGPTIRAAAGTMRGLRAAARGAAHAGLRAATFTMRLLAWLQGPPLGAAARKRAAEFKRLHRRADMEVLIGRDSGGDFDVEIIEFRRAVRDLRARLVIDPILCFETPEQPGVLWFESHWYEGQDGKLYVAY